MGTWRFFEVETDNGNFALLNLPKTTMYFSLLVTSNHNRQGAVVHNCY